MLVLRRSGLAHVRGVDVVHAESRVLDGRVDGLGAELLQPLSGYFMKRVMPTPAIVAFSFMGGLLGADVTPLWAPC
jgi:hypothetical protein